MKILIRNLAREVTQPELQALFEAHGRVQSCAIVMDQVTGGSKGFGFANMPVPHEAKAAIRALNGLDVRGSKMRVKKAEPVPAAAEASAQTDSGQTEPVQETAIEAGARPRIKKDGSPLGSKKTRTFRKKT